MHSSNDQVVLPNRKAAFLFAAAPLVIVAIGYAFDQWLWPSLLIWASDPTASAASHQLRVAVLIAGMLATVSSLSLGVALWLWLMAARILRYRVFPPPGYLVLVKTTVVRDAEAVRHARRHLLYGVLCLAIGGAVIWSMFAVFPLATALRAIGG